MHCAGDLHVANLLFCRYGLSDSDLESDEDEGEGGSQVPLQEKKPTQPQTQAQPAKDAPTEAKDKAVSATQGYGIFDEDEMMDDDSGSDQTGAPDSLLL